MNTIRVKKIEMTVKPFSIDYDKTGYPEDIGMQKFELTGQADGEFIMALVKEVERLHQNLPIALVTPDINTFKDPDQAQEVINQIFKLNS